MRICLAGYNGLKFATIDLISDKITTYEIMSKINYN